MIRQTFPLSQLQELSDKLGFTQHNTQIEDDRCQRDIMYKLFKRPHTLLGTLLPGFTEIARKKNAPDYGKSALIHDAGAFVLEHRRADHTIKLFHLLIILSREEEAQNVIKAGQPRELGQLFAQRYIPQLQAQVESTFRFPFGEANIIDIVRVFVQRAEHMYVLLTTSSPDGL